MPRLTAGRRFRFQSVHSLNTGFHRERKHGHDYILEVYFSPEITLKLHSFVSETLLPRLHGRDLNSVVHPATGEKLVEWIHEQIRSRDELAIGVHAVALQETTKNRFVSSASELDLV